MRLSVGLTCKTSRMAQQPAVRACVCVRGRACARVCLLLRQSKSTPRRATMRPYLLKGHDRPLTQVKCVRPCPRPAPRRPSRCPSRCPSPPSRCRFNREGDLFVTCAKVAGGCWWWCCAQLLCRPHARPCTHACRQQQLQMQQLHVQVVLLAALRAHACAHEPPRAPPPSHPPSARRTTSPACGGLMTASAWARLRATMVPCGAATSHVGRGPGGRAAACRGAPMRTPPAPAPTLLTAGESERLITASADQSVRIWDMQNGKELFQFKMAEPCRAVNLSLGEQMLAFSTDAFMGSSPMIHVVKLEEDLAEQTSKTVLGIEAPKGRITRVYWSDMNRTLVSSHDGGFVRKWDTEVRGAHAAARRCPRAACSARPACLPACQPACARCACMYVHASRAHALPRRGHEPARRHACLPARPRRPASCCWRSRCTRTPSRTCSSPTTTRASSPRPWTRRPRSLMPWSLRCSRPTRPAGLCSRRPSRRSWTT